MLRAIKCFGRNAGHTDLFDQIVSELVRGSLEHVREICHQEIGSLGYRRVETAPFDGGDEELTLGLIGGTEFCKVAIRQIERVGHRLLRWVMNREGNELVST